MWVCEMNLVSGVQAYLLRVLGECGPGMKVLLLDTSEVAVVEL